MYTMTGTAMLPPLRLWRGMEEGEGQNPTRSCKSTPSAPIANEEEQQRPRGYPHSCENHRHTVLRLNLL